MYFPRFFKVNNLPFQDIGIQLTNQCIQRYYLRICRGTWFVVWHSHSHQLSPGAERSTREEVETAPRRGMVYRHCKMPDFEWNYLIQLIRHRSPCHILLWLLSCSFFLRRALSLAAAWVSRLQPLNGDLLTGKSDYCIAAFAVIIIISGFQWIVDGRKNYTGPRIDLGVEWNKNMPRLGYRSKGTWYINIKSFHSKSEQFNAILDSWNCDDKFSSWLECEQWEALDQEEDHLSMVFYYLLT